MFSLSLFLEAKKFLEILEMTLKLTQYMNNVTYNNPFYSYKQSPYQK